MILKAGYIACTMAAFLEQPVVDTTQCIATADLSGYEVVVLAKHLDGTAEVQLDLLDDTTAILWVDQDAIPVHSKGK